MIDPKELRLGNMVLEAGEPSHIYSISSGGISFYTINGINVNRETGCTLNGGEERFKPIPITGEWLERMGFELVVWNDVIRQYFVPVTKNSRCVLSLKFGEYIGFPDRLDKVTIGTPPFESGSTYGTFAIQYVHQLMNLYYSLTGEELTVKEKV